MKPEKKEKIPFKLHLLSWVPALISMALVVCIMIPALMWLVPQGSLISIVDGTSMDTTLHDGQFMFQAGKDFARGDIVICKVEDKNTHVEKILVKRIIGMPGETVHIDATGVYIDGQKLEEDYLDSDKVSGTYREYLLNDIQLSDDAYFLLGDNRPVSSDSRFFGAVRQEKMLFKVTAQPTMPFFLTLGKVLLIAAVACVVSNLMDELLTKLLCKHNPELAKLMEAEKQKGRKDPKGQQDQNDANPQA